MIRYVICVNVPDGATKKTERMVGADVKTLFNELRDAYGCQVEISLIKTERREIRDDNG